MDTHEEVRKKRNAKKMRPAKSVEQMLHGKHPVINADLAKKIGRAVISGLSGDLAGTTREGLDAAIDLLTHTEKMEEPSFRNTIEIFWANVAVESLQRFLISGRVSRDFTEGELKSVISKVTEHYKIKNSLESLSVDQVVQSFENPTSIPAYGLLRSNLGEILSSVDPGYRSAMANRLSLDQDAMDGVVIRVAEEIWGANKNFTTFLERILFEKSHNGMQLRSTWASQHNWLRQLFHERPIWAFPDNEISLSDVYIKPRAESQILVSEKHDEYQSVRGWLDVSILEWFNSKPSAEPPSSMRLVSGGPGSGKSSFAKAIAATLSALPFSRVLLIEAQHLSGTGRLSEQVEDYLRRGGNFTDTPLLRRPYNKEKLTIIFDGLDEISRSDRDVGFTAGFVGNVVQLLHELNFQTPWARAIVLGRPISISSAVRENGLPRTLVYEICSLSPIPVHSEIDDLIDGYNDQLKREKKRDIANRIKYIVEQLKVTKSVSPVDQRDSFWKVLSRVFPVSDEYLKGKVNPLTDERYGDLTSEPILIFLLFMSGEFEESKSDFKKASMDGLYQRIISKLRPRTWGGVEHPSTRGLRSDDEYLFLLECLGISAWISGGRIGEVSTFEMVRSELVPINFSKSVLELPAAQLKNIATSFFTRADGGFEFVHKSFSDFLAARGFLRFFTKTIIDVLTTGGQHDALVKLMPVFSRSALTNDMLRFVREAMSGYTQSELRDLLKCYEEVISYAAVSGPRVGMFGVDESLRDVIKQTASCELAIKALHHALREELRERYGEARTIAIPWDRSPFDATSWIQALRSVSEDEFVFTIMSGMDLRGVCLASVYCKGANFDGSDLREAKIIFSSFEAGNFRNCDFREGDLRGSNFTGSDFEWANFLNAKTEFARMPLEWDNKADGRRRD